MKKRFSVESHLHIRTFGHARRPFLHLFYTSHTSIHIYSGTLNGLINMRNEWVWVRNFFIVLDSDLHRFIITTTTAAAPSVHRWISTSESSCVCCWFIVILRGEERLLEGAKYCLLRFPKKSCSTEDNFWSRWEMEYASLRKLHESNRNMNRHRTLEYYDVFEYIMTPFAYVEASSDIMRHRKPIFSCILLEMEIIPTETESRIDDKKDRFVSWTWMIRFQFCFSYFAQWFSLISNRNGMECVLKVNSVWLRCKFNYHIQNRFDRETNYFMNKNMIIKSAVSVSISANFQRYSWRIYVLYTWFQCIIICSLLFAISDRSPETIKKPKKVSGTCINDDSIRHVHNGHKSIAPKVNDSQFRDAKVNVERIQVFISIIIINLNDNGSYE